MSYRGKSVFVCLLLISACSCFQARRGEPAQRSSVPAPALQGAAAVQQLKADGGYASLAAAMAAARYQINAVPAQTGQTGQSGQSGARFYADNPVHQLQVTFATDEVRVKATSNKTEGNPDGAELRLQLTGFGYGEQLEPLAAGVLTANGDRVEIRKSSIRMQSGPRSAITEWYVNKPEGLEQGFTLAAPPAPRKDGEWLRVALAIGNGWHASVRSDQQGALFERQADGLQLGYDHLVAYDAQGRTLPARMSLGMALEGGELALLVDDAQAVYPLTIDPILTQQQKLTAADGAADDRFSTSVALSGDTAVVGASGDDIGANADQGSAFVFIRSGGVWAQQQKLIASDGATVDFFGVSVALSGDTLVVGAHGDAIGANADQGSAYVFTRSGEVWTQQQKLTASDGTTFDFFGVSVAINGDTAVVGAATDDIGGNVIQGSAYVFTRSGSVWTQQQKLTAADGAAEDFFGTRVAISGDTVVVAALAGEVGANSNQGSAYVFTRSGAVWTQQQKLTADDGAADDLFGSSVAISGDTVVVGAPYATTGAKGKQGAGYVFVRGGAVWTQQQKIVANDGAAGDVFGASVALSGDTVVVGAFGGGIGGNFDPGSAYVFARSGTLWTQQQKLTAQDGAAGDNFGNSVALSGDTVVVGAPFDDIDANRDQGSAYVFVIRENDHIQEQQLSANDGAANDGFGFSVALSGDTLVIGAEGNDIGPNPDQGSAYVFVRLGGVWTMQQKLVAEDGAAGNFFGISVGIGGDTLVVGAGGNAVGANPAQGSAYVFTRSGEVWTLQQKLTADDGGTNDLFGRSVAISGDNLVAGAAGHNGSGAAYVFTRSGAVWTKQQKLVANDGSAGDFFGISVALSGDTVVVGASFDVIGTAVSQGSAYVFTRGGTVWTQQQKLTSADGSAEDIFGISVALSGDTVVVGAPLDVIGANASQGSACVFVRSGTVWTQQQKLIPDGGGPGDRFGFSVALNGERVVVGANNDKIDGNVVQGSAYVFTGSGKVWTQQQKLIAKDGAAGDVFGVSVALSGDTVVVGAPSDDIGANVNQGSAYVFVSSACQTITLDPVSLPDGQTGVSYNQTVTASGGAGPYQFSLSDGAWPPGLILAQNGQISGVPTVAGTYRFTITATILSSLCSGSRSYTLTVNSTCPTVTINPGALPAGQSGVAYSQQLSGSGGNAPYSFTVAPGALPGGLTLTPGGLLSGAPTAFGTFNFIVQVRDVNGCLGARTYALFITACPAITVNPETLPDGTLGATYDQMVTASGGSAPYSFTLSAGALPTGLSLAANGALSGTPTVAGRFNFTVQATDANGCQGERAYSATINQAGGGGNNGLQFYPLAHPIRLLDTRPGQLGCFTPGAPIAGGTSRTQTASGVCNGLNIPANARAIIGNITTINSDGGFLTLFPSDAQQPLVANTNYLADEIVNNAFTVGLGADGAFKIFALNTTDVVVDVTGYYAPPATGGLYFHLLPHPIRLLETRSGFTGCIAPGAPLPDNAETPQLARLTCDGVTIPNTALAIVGNATTVSPRKPGFLTLFPAGAPRPLVASSNYGASQVVNAPFTVGLSATGAFNIFTTAQTHLVIDVSATTARRLPTPTALDCCLIRCRNQCDCWKRATG